MGKKAQQFIWNGIDLDLLRQVMDKPVDDAVSALLESGSMDHLRTLLIEMAQNDSIVSDQLPKPMYDFIRGELAYSFSPEDIGFFNQTHEIWKEKGMKFIFILMFRSLPYTYMAEKPANVLKMTKLLIEHPERRIFETAQFVFDVMDKNWWEPDKRGILTALKVRIMHAAMRHIILDHKEGEKWNEAWGKPINQEDIVATNQVFSLEFFKGMSMLGDTLNPQEQQAWFHTWKTIGRIMGVQDELICKDLNEAWTLQQTVYNHLFKDKTEAGIPLTKALVQTMEHFHLPLELTLLIMKRMLADDQFPDCFDRMLGPSYQELYPEFFTKHETTSEKEKHEKLLRSQFHHHLKNYYVTILDKKTDYQKVKPKQGIIERIIAWVMKMIGRIENRKLLIDLHIDILHEILHHEGTDELIDELDEKLIVDSMSALGGIMIGILSLHFREGKQSGFRIPADLQEYWSLT